MSQSKENMISIFQTSYLQANQNLTPIMMLQTTNQQQFCSWDARSLPDTIILIVLMAIIFLLFSRVLHRLLTYKIIDHYNKRAIIYLHILILLWASVNISQKLFGVVIYFTVLKDAENPDMTKYSIENQKFGMLPGFFLHSIFLQVFYLYYKGLLNSIEFSQLKPFQRNLNKFFRIYYVVRIIIKIIFLILLFTLDQLSTIVLISSLCIISTNIDGIIIFAFLFISYRILSKLFEKIPFQNEQNKKKLKNQYKFIVIICLLRQIIITLFLQSVKQALFGPENDRCFENIQNHVGNTIVYVIINSCLYHIIPVAWIIRIYDLKGSTILKAKSCIRISSASDLSQEFIYTNRQKNSINK